MRWIDRLKYCSSVAVMFGMCCAWGFPVHRHINRSATQALPQPLRGWLMCEVEWLSAHATDADKRKHTVEREAPRHYLDGDAPALACLDTLGEAPWYDRALLACTEDTLWEYGVLPWQIGWSYRQLVVAFDSLDRAGILRNAADLGHYVADAHVPLHTTLNYNGQMTGQDGIHGVWETRLPALFGGGYGLFVEDVGYIHDVNLWAWEAMSHSHSCVPLVLSEERHATALHGEGLVREERGGRLGLERDEAWCATYHDGLNGMVEAQWRASILGVSSLWYSAWIDAGEPDLSRVFEPERRSWWRRFLQRLGWGSQMERAPVP